jgi:uncharacterized lipoprotein YajG
VPFEEFVEMKHLLLPAIALAVLAGPVAAAPTTHAATKTTAAKAKPVRMSRSESLCLRNVRSKYKAGKMRNRAEARCRTEAHAMRHDMSKPAKRKA